MKRLCLALLCAHSVCAQVVDLELRATSAGTFELRTIADEPVEYYLVHVFLEFDPERFVFAGWDSEEVAWDIIQVDEVRPGQVSWQGVAGSAPIAPNLPVRFQFESSGTGCVVLGSYSRCGGCPHYDMPPGFDYLPSGVWQNVDGGIVLLTNEVQGDCTTTCPGDRDGDNSCGLSDLGLVLATYGVGTNLSDLTRVLAHFGASCAP